MENSSKSAYPILGDTLSDDIGLTKREYFAALAMQGILASGSIYPEKILAEQAAIYADTLLKELEK